MAEITPMLAYAAVLLFFLVAIPRDDNSILGTAGKLVDDFLTTLVGTSSMSRCPFLRRGMLIHQFTAYDYPVDITACEGECEVNCAGDDLSGDKITVYESTMVKVHVGDKPSCDLDEFLNFNNPNAAILRCVEGSKNCDEITSASAVCGAGSAKITVCLSCDKGPCKCEDDYGLMHECNLDEFVLDTFFSSQAEKERDLFAMMGTDMPPWVCYVFFGILPFMVIYYFIQDILHFTMISPSTKRAVALAIGLIGIFTGAFVGITVALVRFMRFSTNQTTLYLLIGTALLTSFMLIFQTALRPIQIYRGQSYKLKKSIKALKSIYSDLNRPSPVQEEEDEDGGGGGGGGVGSGLADILSDMRRRRPPTGRSDDDINPDTAAQIYS